MSSISKHNGTSTRILHEQCARPSITFSLHRACERVLTSLKDEEMEQFESGSGLNRKRISSSSKRSSMASIQNYCTGVMETLKSEEVHQMTEGEKQASDLSKYAYQHALDAVNDSEEFRRMQAAIRAKRVCTCSAMREALIHDYCAERLKEKKHSNGKSTLEQESNSIPSKLISCSSRSA